MKALTLFFLMGCVHVHSNVMSVTDVRWYDHMRATSDHRADVTWTVVGAGPAGIAVIGILLDIGVFPDMIRWVDSEFNVGRLGKYYYNVPGNAKAMNYVRFLDSCNTFKDIKTPAIQALRNHNQEDACVLNLIIDALQDITYYLLKRVNGIPHRLVDLSLVEDEWRVTLSDTTVFTSHNIVLATGSHPRSLDYGVSDEIPLDLALDKETLSGLVSSDDTVAVVGGSHSAILILKYLYELRTKRIVNLYKHPISYFYDMGDGNETAHNGLKGSVAHWAYHVLEKEYPEEILRLKNSERARDSWLPICKKIIYAIGYERNELPFLHIDSNQIAYNSTTGAICPRLFGIGLAFPEEKIDEVGQTHQLIGIIDFMNYAQRIVPQWISVHSYKHLNEFQSLFRICLL